MSRDTSDKVGGHVLRKSDLDCDCRDTTPPGDKSPNRPSAKTPPPISITEPKEKRMNYDVRAAIKNAAAPKTSTRGTANTDLSWQADALCAQTNPEAFFPAKGDHNVEAKKICGACDVKKQCLTYALANDENIGIWGGLSAIERRRLTKQKVA